jgi:hypothetical protein
MKFLSRFAPLFLCLALAACQAPMLSSLLVQSGQTLFQDDFSNPASGWAHTISRNGVMDYDSGTYRMLVLAPDYDLWAVSGRTFGDVRLEVGATRVDGPADNRFGLICRFQDPRNFYFFIVSSDGYYAIGKVSGGVRSLLGQSMMAYSRVIVPDAGPNRLGFDCVGSMLSGSVNGQLLAVTQDTDLARGDVGLLVGSFGTTGADVAFDHFVVIKP